MSIQVSVDINVLERSKALVERNLAEQGDCAEPELISLQHALADLLQPRLPKTEEA